MNNNKVTNNIKILSIIDESMSEIWDNQEDEIWNEY
jgi:hypothetical protein